MNSSATLRHPARWPRAAVRGLIRVYQVLISPALPRSCRFYPSCSHYAAEAVERHGVFTGLRMAVVRLAKCHPWHPGGHDPVR